MLLLLFLEEFLGYFEQVNKLTGLLCYQDGMVTVRRLALEPVLSAMLPLQNYALKFDVQCAWRLRV